MATSIDGTHCIVARLLLIGSVPAIKETRIGEFLLNVFATFWIVSLVLLLPIRVFLDRREYPTSQIELEASWPRPLRWLGWRWLERLLWGVIIVMALMLAIPLLISVVGHVLGRIVS